MNHTCGFLCFFRSDVTLAVDWALISNKIKPLTDKDIIVFSVSLVCFQC